MVHYLVRNNTSMAIGDFGIGQPKPDIVGDSAVVIHEPEGVRRHRSPSAFRAETICGIWVTFKDWEDSGTENCLINFRIGSARMHRSKEGMSPFVPKADSHAVQHKS